MPTAVDLVDRQFARTEPERLWVTDITEHPTREGKVYRAVVLDVFSRRMAGWSIDSSPTAALVTNALGMAIDGRRPARGATAIHSDQGTQSVHLLGIHPPRHRLRPRPLHGVDRRLLRQRGHRVVLVTHAGRAARPSPMENPRGLANAIFEYLEVFHNRQRRHSALGMLTPIEFEARHQTPITAA